jgi:hypothetical protein
VRADCRRYRWPERLDVVATDPPWRDKTAYRWLAQFAAKRLREGGLCLVQCGTASIAEVVQVMIAGGLRYNWTLALTYATAFSLRCSPLATAWRPVLLFTRGVWNHQGLGRVSDTLTVKKTGKPLHEWEQPLWPWIKWLEALTRPGEVIGDPYAGAGTIGAALKSVGGRRFIGTEIDASNAKIATVRLGSIEEGQMPD